MHKSVWQIKLSLYIMITMQALKVNVSLNK